MPKVQGDVDEVASLPPLFPEGLPFLLYELYAPTRRSRGNGSYDQVSPP